MTSFLFLSCVHRIISTLIRFVFPHFVFPTSPPNISQMLGYSQDGPGHVDQVNENGQRKNSKWPQVFGWFVYLLERDVVPW